MEQKLADHAQCCPRIGGGQPALGGRLQASRPKVMVTFHADACDKCRRRSPVSFMVEPEEAWRTVVLNRWRDVCPSCFDADEGAPPSLGDDDGRLTLAHGSVWKS
jgi:hypothetical protein